MKISNIFITLLLVTTFNLSYSRDWTLTALDALRKIGSSSDLFKEPTFTQLPKEIQAQIIALVKAGSTATTLDEAARATNTLAQVNQELNQQINNPEYCLALIKNLAQRFSYSDLEVCKALQTQAAKQRLKIQTDLYNLCVAQRPSREAFLKISPGADLTFTYTSSSMQITPLLQLIITESSLSNPCFEEIVRLEPETINLPTSTGRTPLMVAVFNIKWPYIQVLLSLRKLEINKKDRDGNTALMYAIRAKNATPALIDALLKAGANPTIADNKGLTPLALAQQLKNQAIINTVQNAVGQQR